MDEKTSSLLFVVHLFVVCIHEMNTFFQGVYCILVNRAPVVTMANKRCSVSALGMYRVDCGSINFWPVATHGHRHKRDLPMCSTGKLFDGSSASVRPEQHNNNDTRDALTNLILRVLNGM
jgi:hypothetical protein